jgi:hypothetical protein
MNLKHGSCWDESRRSLVTAAEVSETNRTLKHGSCWDESRRSLVTAADVSETNRTLQKNLAREWVRIPKGWSSFHRR